jgi:hypothetical protein
MAVVLCCTGCCTRLRSRPIRNIFPDEPVRPVSQSDSRPADANTGEASVLAELPPPERKKDRLTQELYRRLELSFEMFQKENFDGALREVERVQMDVNEDPYLEMQTWYLSAMIYHKTAKPSRRGRAMRKMLELMETLQKDPRFRESFEEGLMSQQVIDMALSQGEGKYAE